ncbi:hypothetical protein Tco_1423206, partial [Tanacetum coccineum]
LDEYAIRKKVIESKTTVLEANTSKSKTSEIVGKTNEADNKDKVITKDWNSDDEDDVSDVNTFSPVKTNETQTVKTQADKICQTSQKVGIGYKNIKACFVCKSTDHLIKDCNFHAKKSLEPKLKTMVNTGQRVVKPVWDNAKRVNHQIFSNKLKYPQTKKTFVLIGVLTYTGIINPVRPNKKRAIQNSSTARPASTVRPFAPKVAQTSSVIRPIYPRMDNVRPRASYSPIKRSYYTKPTFRPKNLKQDGKTSGVKNVTTVGTRAVVKTGKGKLNYAPKKSRWVWKPKGNYLNHVSKESGSFMLKKFEYADQKGIFKSVVAWWLISHHELATKLIFQTMKITMEALWLLEDELMFNLVFVLQIYDNKIVVSPPLPPSLTQNASTDILSFKLLDESQVVLRAPRQNDVYSLDLKNIVPSGGDICVENQVAVDAGAQESEEVQDSEDVADKEEQHNLAEVEQALKDEREKLVTQEMVAKSLDDATR